MAIPKVNLRRRKSKKGFSYFLDFKLKDKRHRISVGTNKKLAEEIHQRKQAEFALGHFNIPTTSNSIISLEDLIKSFLSSKRNEIRSASFKRYKNYLDKFAEYMKDYFPASTLDVSEIKTNYIDESFNYFLENKITNNKKWEPKTVIGLRTVLIQLFGYGIKQNHLSSNPAKSSKSFRLNSKQIVEYFTDDELKKIWKEVDSYWVDALKFIFYTGLRKGELINLTWKNVNLNKDNPSISIASSEDWKTKSGSARVISLNKSAVNIIERQKGKHKDFIFIQKNGDKIHPDKPYRALKKALKKLDLEGDIHKLRHTFASRLVMKGESLYTVSKLLGHSDTKTTEIYAHLAPDYLKAAVDKLDEEE